MSTITNLRATRPGNAVADASFPQSWNLYSYVMNNPLNFIDPSGLLCVDSNGVGMVDAQGSPLDESACAGKGEWITPVITTVQVNGDIGQASWSDGGPTFFERFLQFKQTVCAAIPSGRVVSLSGSYGNIGGPTGSVEVVTNYNTGEVSGFVSGGAFVGYTGVASASANYGSIYNLGNSNSNYSGPFTTAAGSVGPYGAFLSVTGTPTNLQVGPNKPTVAGISTGVSLKGRAGATVSATFYSKPLPLGNILTNPLLANPVDYGFLLARQVCN